jgi:hypothetical protein
MERWDIEKAEDWMRWVKEIPSFKLDSDWNLQVIPPFAGAMTRFVITQGAARVSIYLDCYNNLGYMDGPYWEIYPYEGDTYRCGINETDDLVNAIRASIKEQLT